MAIVHFVNYKKPQTVGGMLYVLRYTMRDKKTVADDGVKYPADRKKNHGPVMGGM